MSAAAARRRSSPSAATALRGTMIAGAAVRLKAYLPTIRK